MASDQEVAEALNALFREINPNSFSSLNDVILRLQSKLGLDLSHKIDFIRAQITLFFNSPPLQQIDPDPNPNLNLNPSYHVIHHPHSPAHSRVSGSFVGAGGPRGPTEINFGGGVVSESHPPAPAKESAQSRPKRRGGPGGLNKLCGVSPLLQAIVGQPAMPRTEIVRQLWAYIRKNNLQDPSNKRKIICNDELRLVFETDCTDMFQMNKLLSKHIVPLDPTKDLGKPSKKLKVEEVQTPTTEPSTEPSTKTSTESAPIVISQALAKFFGTSEKEMFQSEVYKRMEEYIKAEGLEDPLNSMVICDSKLQELFGCESIPKPGVCEELVRNHLFHRA